MIKTIINEKLLLKLERKYKRTIYDDGRYVIKISIKDIKKCISNNKITKEIQLAEIKSYSRVTGLIIDGNIDKILKNINQKTKKTKNKSARFLVQ
jgi:hypothetical protein